MNSNWLKWSIGLALIAVAIFILLKPGSHAPGEHSTQSNSNPAAIDTPTTLSSKAPKQPISSTLASAAPTATPQASSAGEEPVLAPRALIAVLEKYSGTRDWRFDTDDKGRAFKMTGGKLKGLLKDSAATEAFLSDMQEALGFNSQASFVAESQSSSSFQTVDHKQIVNFPNGESLPVFESKLRLIGDESGDVFMVYNELRPVSLSFRWAAEISDGEAIAIARRHVGSSEIQLKILEPDLAFAHSEPHQKVTQIIAREGAKSRLLLIGHETKTVVWDRPLTVR